MKKILSILSIISLFLGVSYAFASTLPTSIPAVYESYLSAQIGTSDTSLTVANATLRDGTSLSGYQCFTIDANSPTIEYVCGTASSTPTLITGLTRGIDAVTGTTSVTALKYAHRLGADIKISDYPVLTLLTRIINGIDTFPNKLSYGTTTTPTNANDITPKSYVDSLIATATSSLNTALLGGTNTWTGVNTFSAKPVLSVGATVNISPSVSTDIATKGYVDAGILQGAAIATNSITGIGRVASSTQLNGTTSGTTTPYFIPSSLASTTSATSIVVVSNSNGKIDPTFLNGSNENYTLNGNTALATTTVNGSSTFNGAVTFNGSITGISTAKNLFAASSTGAGVFTAPAGVTSFCAYVTGGGGVGGGGVGSTDATGGGGAGGTAEKCFTLSATTTISYSVGASAAASTLTTNSTAGSVSLTGNAGNTGGTGTFGLGGTGGTATGGAINITGGSGTFGIHVGSSGDIAGTGGGSIYGSGGRGPNTTPAAGTAGSAFGSGGSGATGLVGSGGTPGAGAQGLIIITY